MWFLLVVFQSRGCEGDEVLRRLTVGIWVFHFRFPTFASKEERKREEGEEREEPERLKPQKVSGEEKAGE